MIKIPKQLLDCSTVVATETFQMVRCHSDHNYVSFVVIVTILMVHVVTIVTMLKRFTEGIIVTSVLFHACRQLHS
jgi:hypothetical protein